MGIINTQTVIACGLSVDIYPSFDPTEVITCPYVSIAANHIQLINMNITFETEEQVNIQLYPQSIFPPKLFIKLHNNSLVQSMNPIQINTYYLSFSSELICRFSSSNNTIICFYYPSSTNFHQIEDHFDKITNTSPLVPIQRRNRFVIIFVIIGILILIVCVFALYILCTSRVSFHHMVQLDYIIDPQLAKEASLKLAPEIV